MFTLPLAECRLKVLSDFCVEESPKRFFPSSLLRIAAHCLQKLIVGKMTNSFLKIKTSSEPDFNFIMYSYGGEVSSNQYEKY